MNTSFLSVCVIVLSICIYLCLWCYSLSVFIFLNLAPYLSIVQTNPLNLCLDPSLSNIHPSPLLFLSFHLLLSLCLPLPPHVSVVSSSNWFSFLPVSQFFIKSSVIISVWSVIYLFLTSLSHPSTHSKSI